MPLQCSICLSSFREPVCLPCGHIYCKNCVAAHVNVPTNRGMTSTCPECRKPFHLTVPDVTYLPEKYRPFIAHAIRRVYIDTAPTDAEADAAELTEEVEELARQVTRLQSKLTRKAEVEAMLIRECERLTEEVAEQRDALEAAHTRATEYADKLHEVQGELKYQKERSKKKHLDMTSGLTVLQEQKQNYRDALTEASNKNAQLTKKLMHSEVEKLRMTGELLQLRAAVSAAGHTVGSSASSSPSSSSSDSGASSASSASSSTSKAASNSGSPEAEAGPSRLRNHILRARAFAHASAAAASAASSDDDDDDDLTPTLKRTPVHSSPSISSPVASGLRMIKPLPKRLRVTRAREDDSVVLSASAKRARVLRG